MSAPRFSSEGSDVKVQVDIQVCLPNFRIKSFQNIPGLLALDSSPQTHAILMQHVWFPVFLPPFSVLCLYCSKIKWASLYHESYASTHAGLYVYRNREIGNTPWYFECLMCMCLHNKIQPILFPFLQGLVWLLNPDLILRSLTAKANRQAGGEPSGVWLVPIHGLSSFSFPALHFAFSLSLFPSFPLSLFLSFSPVFCCCCHFRLCLA